ncbi:hypothetical protein HHI36_005620 [Cryptolaemus montrouzieri]|uniref:C2H2-type domain-containing protein n=1 Tax=Cryptolaemus montrouzieri TaxID=559131 RepID=A0ABD2NUQ9_9CUCU
MTMDVSNRKVDLRADHHIDNTSAPIQITTNKMSVKRPFDVAFLMLPDEKLKQKKLAKIQDRKIEVPPPEVVEEQEEEIEVVNYQENYKNECKIQKFLSSHQKHQIFDDPGLIKAKNLDELRGKTSPNQEQRSAFTKVNLMTKEAPSLSPALSVSPDLSYQHSLSPSPPIRTYQNFSNNLMSPSHMFKAQGNGYSSNFENFNGSPGMDGHHFLVKTDNILANNLGKVRPMYRPELAYNYGQFQNHTEMMKLSPATPELGLRNPAAAILTSLLPPSLAALSLPAQNVCAKCNISFRMTSDLVYHMRSHHKNDSVDMNRKRREDKLKCPVCAESFRERHHLTRHMTAHQDKEDDNIVKKKDSSIQ